MTAKAPLMHHLNMQHPTLQISFLHNFGQTDAFTWLVASNLQSERNNNMTQVYTQRGLCAW